MKIVKYFTTYILIFLFYTLVFFLLYYLPVFNSQKVLFYRGNLLLILSLFITMTILFVIKRQVKVVQFETIIASTIIAYSLHLAFFVVFPVTFDRSVTTYLLTTVNKSHSKICKNITIDQLENRFIDEYVIKNQAIQRRLREQKAIDTLNSNSMCVNITQKGKLFLKLIAIISNLYNIK